MSIIDRVTGDSEKQKDNYKVSPTPKHLKRPEKVAIITSNETEDLEFFYPYYRLSEAGYTVDIITPNGGKFAGKHGLGLNETKPIADAKPADYALLYLPGGKAPSELRENGYVLTFVREFARSGKAIASVCHGPQILISAGVVQGKQIAAWPEVGKELQEAGATFVDEALVEDGQFITSRKPGDLPRHLYGIMQYLEGNYSTTQSHTARKAAGA